MLRKIFKFIAIFIGLIVLFLFWALQTVDYTPYFETDYYKTTKLRFDSLSTNMKVFRGQVFVGFGKQSITPILHGNEDDPSTGKFIEIYLTLRQLGKGVLLQELEKSKLLAKDEIVR